MKQKRDLVLILAACAFISGITLQIWAYDAIIVHGFNNVSHMIEEDLTIDRRTLHLRANEQIAGSLAFYSITAGAALLTLTISFVVVALRKKKPPNQEPALMAQSGQGSS